MFPTFNGAWLTRKEVNGNEVTAPKGVGGSDHHGRARRRGRGHRQRPDNQSLAVPVVFVFLVDGEQLRELPQHVALGTKGRGAASVLPGVAPPS
jgi:hypothetical protein